MRVFVNRQTHCLLILSYGFALVLRENGARDEQEQKKKDQSRPPKLFIEFVPEDMLPSIDSCEFQEVCLGQGDHDTEESSRINSGLGDVPYFSDHKERKFYGLLGFYALKGRIYVGFIVERAEVGSAIINQRIYRIDNTVFLSLDGDCYDYYSRSDSKQSKHGSSSSSSSSVPSLSSVPSTVGSIQKLLASGTFFYSPNYDMSSCLQERSGCCLEGQAGGFPDDKKEFQFDPQLYKRSNSRFVWNSSMISGLVTFRSRLSEEEGRAFDKGRFLVTIVRGFAQSLTIRKKNVNDFLLMTIITKQDCKKSGSLLGPYGMDDNGNVTNFAETEFIVSDRGHCYSFVLLRGNVPLFWKLERQLVSTKLQFPRSNEASKHAFIRHFDELVCKYGSIHVVDALSSKGTQPELSRRYDEALRANITEGVPVLYTKIEEEDFSVDPKHNRLLWKPLRELDGPLSEFQVFCSSLEGDRETKAKAKHETEMRQRGTFLVNTLDSNKRANFVQMNLSERIMESLLGKLVSESAELRKWFWNNHQFLWDGNGRSLGKLADHYNGSIRTKNKRGGLVGKMASQSKKYVSSSSSSNSGKQNQFDRLLGRLSEQYEVQLIDPIHDYVVQELEKRSSQFVSKKHLSVFTVTFNVNAEQSADDISRLIYPEQGEDGNTTLYDVVMVGLEEVVELSPGKIMSIDPTIRLFWEQKIQAVLVAHGGQKYTLLRGEQLGGILALVFVRGSAENSKYIKEIETASKKTGLKGMAANKGGVAISFSYSNHLRLCFVVSHLAAGFNNAEERHQDFKTIANGMQFSKSRGLRDFDVVFWMGDFNFRIDSSNEDVRSLIAHAKKHPDRKQQVINKLFESDQLNRQMSSGETFPFFDEHEISFLPTYKFDKGTDVYDSSEKERVPAWTDRIVTFAKKRSILEQLSYNSVPELKFSDHRPVYAIFRLAVDIIDDETRSVIEKKLYESRKMKVRAASLILSKDISGGYDDVLHYGLPAPSSKGKKWWLQPSGDDETSGNIDSEIKRCRVRFRRLDSGKYELNPEMSYNPFVGTDSFVRKK